MKNKRFYQAHKMHPVHGTWNTNLNKLENLKKGDMQIPQRKARGVIDHMSNDFDNFVTV